MAKYNVFYGADAPFIVDASDTWEAQQKGIVRLEAKYPKRQISQSQVVAKPA